MLAILSEFLKARGENGLHALIFFCALTKLTLVHISLGEHDLSILRDEGLIQTP